jgi:hypothetical protein
LVWGKIQPNGLRWVKLNPRPKLLIPFTADRPALVHMTLAHEGPQALETLRVVAYGESIPVCVGPASEVGAHWQAVATFEIGLSTDDYTILELELKGHKSPKGRIRG